MVIINLKGLANWDSWIHQFFLFPVLTAQNKDPMQRTRKPCPPQDWLRISHCSKGTHTKFEGIKIMSENSGPAMGKSEPPQHENPPIERPP